MSSSSPGGGWEALFWHAFENSHNPLLLLDQDRVVVAVNHAATEMLGRSPDEVIGRRGDLLIAPAGWKRIEAEWREVLRVGRHSTTQEVLRPDGHRVWVEFAAHRETVTGRQLILIVVLEARTRPPGRLGASSVSAAVTPREVEVVTELAMGRRVHEIADVLHIAPTTARTHVRHAMSKLGARSHAQLVAIAIAEGLLDSGAVNRQIRR